ncbi:hypothetical protein PGTUg99_034656 [Puccinia graminis f. sp. tritici]|uniref:Uncharacterized protein n=1 Tax=Puccinia graminis f. sp. tritici TaxID=56615 RepID=A0A5B0MHN6_PUCGR|nr:hypothetical protein PGTUg99_034656 [Puccinia graminis f. sp. tritici]
MHSKSCVSGSDKPSCPSQACRIYKTYVDLVPMACSARDGDSEQVSIAGRKFFRRGVEIKPSYRSIPQLGFFRLDGKTRCKYAYFPFTS